MKLCHEKAMNEVSFITQEPLKQIQDMEVMKKQLEALNKERTDTLKQAKDKELLTAKIAEAERKFQVEKKKPSIGSLKVSNEPRKS